MTPQVFAIISRLVEDKTGIHYGIEDRELLGAKVGRRAEAAGFESLLDYYYYLRYDDVSSQELDALIDALVVGETFFFREFVQLEVLVSDFVVPAVLRGERPRVWSAACATGEEIISVAMLLADRQMLSHVDLCASDISPKALARAGVGRFGRRSLRDNPVPSLAERWLTTDGDHYVVSRALLAAIRFQRINLMCRPEVESIGPCDVILCRNVLIYFAEDTVQQVVSSLERQLRPEGALFVGVSESLLRFASRLRCEDHRGAFVYRRVAS
jgi:chemotaxis protein methyltransferase CheR